MGSFSGQLGRAHGMACDRYNAAAGGKPWTGKQQVYVNRRRAVIERYAHLDLAALLVCKLAASSKAAKASSSASRPHAADSSDATHPLAAFISLKQQEWSEFGPDKFGLGP